MEKQAILARAAKYAAMGIATSAFLLVETGQARAQMSPDLIMETYNSNINAIVSSRINAHVLDQAIRRNGGRGSSVRHHASSGGGSGGGSTRFVPSSAARKRTLAGIVAKARTTNPQAAAALERDFAKGDPVVAIAPGLARYGLHTDDVADAMTAYLVSAWYGVRGSNEDPPRDKVRAVREQMQRVLLSTPSFGASSNATKQQMSDSLLLQLMVTERLVSSAKGDAANMDAVKNTIRQSVLKTLKIDMTKAELTSKGLQL